MRTLQAALIVLAVAVLGMATYLINGVTVRPTGPYTLLATVPYALAKSTESTSLMFSPKFNRNHEVAILCNKPFSVSTIYSEKIRVEVFRFGIATFDKILSERQRSLVGRNYASTDEISLGWIAAWDLIPGSAIARLTVADGEPLPQAEDHDCKIAVRPSPVL